MGVVKGSGSMSSTTDVIYTHKKFKKAVAETWEKKEEKVFGRQIEVSSESDTFLCRDRCLSNTTCIDLRVPQKENGESNILSDSYATNTSILTSESLKRCHQNDVSNKQCHQCQIILGDVKLSGTKSQEHTCNLSVYSDNTCPRNASGRLPDSIQLDKNDSCHNTNLDNMGKQLYKPKFRGCLNENEVQPLSSIPDSLGSPVFPAALGSSDEVHNSHPSSKLRVSIGQLRSNSLELKNSESEDTSPITGLVSECKNIWKGIKSPSPELVSQHINNLIVQNQAIVETHNPLWSVKFRRQSSLNSNPEIDSVSTSKSKKNIPKTVKASSNVQIIQDPSLYYEKDPKLNMGINSALSVIHVNRASKNISNATVSSFLPCGLTPVYVNNVNSSLVQGYVGIDLSNKKNPVPEFIPDAIDQSKSFSVANISKSWCNKCGDISGNEKKNFHINYCLNQPLAYTNTELNVSGRNVQNVALNLHKNGDKRSLVGHFNSNKYDVNHDETSVLPPTKRQKITSFGSYSSKPLLPAQDANTLQQSYNRYINIDHGGNSESSNLYGGQVRISGERGMKTISINPMKGSSPSLDLSIVSKQLQTQEVAELQIPTSVVVTIAKCGLNSGGTMVKIDKKSENYFSHTSSNSSNLGPKVDLPIGQEELSTRLQFDCRTESNGRSYPKLKFKSDSHIVTSKIDESSKTPTLISKNSISDSNQKSQDFSSHSLIQKISCKFNEAQRSGLSDTIGRKVPYVPGIPGPYSQAGVVFSPGLAQTKIGEVSSPKAPALNLHQKVVSDSNYKTSQNSRSESRIVLMQNKLNEKPVIKPSIEITCDNNEVSENKIEENFLLPTKRPNTLLLKPQPFVDKKSLIGSTLVSPDTPRPKKSCAQLFLNGSAYTYLNLKVSTKTFFCCIYRPQPMYLLQSTNPKLSMYSNWQICKTSQTLNLSPLEAMGLHVSGAYYDKTYTIAKPTEIELQLTDSGYLKKNILKSSTIAFSQSNLTNPSSENIPNSTENANEEKLVSKQEREVASEVKRIKIFEGGFKTYEDYTYVRGRGRGRYVCERCGIRCRKPSMLKKHIRTHTDLRPFACHHCSFRFKTKGNLTKHLKSKAHYKKCSELGIDPVPLVFDDNQTSPDESQDSSSLKGHPSSINTELDEEDEDDDDDEGDDCEDDDDDDDQEELDVEWDADKVFEDSNHSQSQPEDLSLGASAQSYKSVQSSLRFQSNSSMSGSSSSDDFSINENVPMDLTVKSTVSPFSGKSRPEMSICTNEDSSSCSSGASKDTSSNVLSLVTKSSDMLRTIYDTTNKISANNFTTLKPKSLDESNCDGPMLQNYLTECAVFDSARKRSQYLISTVQSTQPMVTTTTTTSSISTSIPITSSIRLDTESEQVPTSQTIIREESKADENKEIEKAESTSHNLPTNNPPSGKDNQSNILTSINSKLTKKTDSQPLPTPLSSADHSLSSAGSAIFAQSKPESSSVRRGTKSSAISFEAVHAIPSPPANLTVMNSCSGDSKTTFISPSGIIPTTTNNRNLSSEDGKCRCNVCHKEFSKQGQLRLHINIHYIERPHRCDACGISFRTNGHLQKHKRSVTHFNKVNMNMTFGTPSTANPRPFKCHDCKVAFRIYGHLAKHLRSKLHILKLECLGKLPFGIYADIERSGINLNEIDTSDCENSLESLQLMANVLYKKEPSKLLTWRNQLKNSGQSAGNEGGESRNRTESNSSTNSEDYPLLDEPDPLSAIPTNDADSVNEDDVEEMVAQDSTQTSTNSS